MWDTNAPGRTTHFGWRRPCRETDNDRSTVPEQPCGSLRTFRPNTLSLFSSAGRHDPSFHMSLQVFLQAHLVGANSFLATASADYSSPDAFLGRCVWLTLLAEVLPRALLAELKLSPMLLGSSSAEQFLLVLAEEDVPRANALLQQASEAVRHLSADTLRLVWSSTENLGAWPVARKRLDDALETQTSTPLGFADVQAAFQPIADEPEIESATEYFAAFARGQVSARTIGWSADEPAKLHWDSGQYTWIINEHTALEVTGIPFPRRIALDDNGARADLQELASRASGAARWGILLGDIDQFDAQLKQVPTVEEHIQLSMLLKDFFAGELALLCTMPDFWRKVTVLYRGGDDFAVLGSWDALLTLAREFQRLFEKFAEHNLQAGSQIEGKTVSMSLAIAPEIDADPAAVYEEAWTELQAAKATEAGTFRLFGRALEWKRLADAEELKASLVRLVKDFGFSPEYIHDLVSVYREALPARASRRKAARVDRPWRLYMRLASVIPQARGKELNNVRNSVIASLIGKRTASLKLRPSGRVGLEWARLASTREQQVSQS